MPEFISVQCYQCKQYQVSQRRKDGKFNCKLCGSKQSVRKIVARSDKASDVRRFVQQLNLNRGQAEEHFEDLHSAKPTGEYGYGDEENPEDVGNLPAKGYSLQDSYANELQGGKHEDRVLSKSRSKWAPYDAMLAQWERAHSDDGVEESGKRKGRDDEAGEEEYVTALPDSHTRRSGKRKRAGRTERATTRSAKRRSSDGPYNPDEGHFEANAAGKKGSEGTRMGPYRGQYPSARTVTTRDDSQRRRDRWSRWDDAAPSSRTEFRRDDFGDGTFTTLGRDEVVDEDIAY